VFLLTIANSYKKWFNQDIIADRYKVSTVFESISEKFE